MAITEQPRKQGILERLARAGLATGQGFAEGKVIEPETEDNTDMLDRLIKEQSLETGSADFKREIAGTKFQADVDKSVQIDEAKRKLRQAEYDEAQGQQPQTPEPTLRTPQQPQPSLPQTRTAVGASASDGTSRFVQKPPTTEYDTSLGKYVTKQGGFVENPDYLDVGERAELEETRQLEELRNQSARTDAEDMLESIQEAKKGKDFFGPLGFLPSIAAPSSYTGNRLGKETTLSERKLWESHVNKLLADKVIDVMNEMKRVSKTGATGFGQLNKSELTLLKESSTALNKELAPSDALRLLEGMETIQRKFLSGGEDNQQQQDPELQAMEAELARREAQGVR